MTQISYAVMYADDGTFLLAWKPVLGFYAGDGKTGQVWPNGHKLDARGANYALPAGIVGDKDTITSAAQRAFIEQTGQQVPATLSIVPQALSDTCAAAYFRLTNAAAVHTLDGACNTVSFPHAASVAAAVKSQEVKKYSDIAAWAAKKNVVPWPYDNQLQETWCRNLLDPETWNWVQTWRDPLSGLDAQYLVLSYLHGLLTAQGAKPPVPRRRLLRRSDEARGRAGRA